MRVGVSGPHPPLTPHPEVAPAGMEDPTLPPHAFTSLPAGHGREAKDIVWAQDLALLSALQGSPASPQGPCLCPHIQLEGPTSQRELPLHLWGG